MYVRVLFESAGRGERLAAFGTRVRTGARVARPDVPLQVARVAEHPGTGLARELSAVRERRVSDQARSPAVRLRAQLAAVLAGLVMVSGHQMIVQSVKRTRRVHKTLSARRVSRRGHGVLRDACRTKPFRTTTARSCVGRRDTVANNRVERLLNGNTRVQRFRVYCGTPARHFHES